MAGKGRKISEKRRQFVDAYIAEDFNGTKAYQQTYKCTAAAARANAAKTLATTSVQEYLRERLADRSRRVEITQDRVLQEYARLAFFDPRKLFNDDGTPIPIHELDIDTAAAIAGLDVEEITLDKEKIGTVRKYKIANKGHALDSVGRHLGMFQKDNDRDVNITVNRRTFSKPDPAPTKPGKKDA
jgi:phage terminase small subunit